MMCHCEAAFFRRSNPPAMRGLPRSPKCGSLAMTQGRVRAVSVKTMEIVREMGE